MTPPSIFSHRRGWPKAPATIKSAPNPECFRLQTISNGTVRDILDADRVYGSPVTGEVFGQLFSRRALMRIDKTRRIDHDYCGAVRPFDQWYCVV